ncbi:hypothetical protein O6D91_20875 [Cronobacter sakazakii]|uniref:hypothetical protein n=1 Tax=Cronobacter sakazakii TaxID=28141 RepID=UPI0009BB9E4E|nr:hypothetical protein [Cronobacter sakazakii]MCZ6132161.1 hypothetical protein [Cronobacter sakazakii]MCZ6139916.1 hypothetical protein [Cronobacter sakazakii]PUX81478.1 hypothetical protein BTK64_19930 [Cronobacter sakazakii]
MLNLSLEKASCCLVWDNKTSAIMNWCDAAAAYEIWRLHTNFSELINKNVAAIAEETMLLTGGREKVSQNMIIHLVMNYLLLLSKQIEKESGFELEYSLVPPDTSDFKKLTKSLLLQDAITLLLLILPCRVINSLTNEINI